MSSTQDIQLALNRINRALAGKRQVFHRDIRLGLGRISRIVPEKQHWKGVHVGGTNGKGSICAFLGGLFKLAGVGYGSYISPAFPEKHNGVIVNGLYVSPALYEKETKNVQQRWEKVESGWQFTYDENLGSLSPFELETATAFRIFETLRVPYGIVEVGMGGATDATNVMKDKAVTIISKIGLDHQEYLGNTIEKIAKVKAGIMQKNVPCIVDHTNQPSVIRVLREHAREVGTQVVLTWKGEPLLTTLDNRKWKLESYQIQNLLCAALAFRHMFPQKSINLDELMATEPYMPGRLEQVELSSDITGQESRHILVDGAHNMLGVEALVGHVDSRIRKPDQPVTWVMGMSSSKTKPFGEIIKKVVRPEDNFAFAEFTPGPNEPQPTPANFGSDLGKQIVNDPEQIYEGKPDIGSALKWACNKAGQDGPLVFTGSLYLVKELFKLDGVSRKRELKTLQDPETLWSETGLSQMLESRKKSEASSPVEESASAAGTSSGEGNFITQQETEELLVSGEEGELSPEEMEAVEKLKEREDIAALSKRYQRKASFHKAQVKGYRKMMGNIHDDILNASKTFGDVDDSLINLAKSMKDVEQQIAKHRKAYQEAKRSVTILSDWRFGRKLAGGQIAGTFQSFQRLDDVPPVADPAPEDVAVRKRAFWDGFSDNNESQQWQLEQQTSVEETSGVEAGEDAEEQAMVVSAEKLLKGIEERTKAEKLAREAEARERAELAARLATEAEERAEQCAKEAEERAEALARDKADDPFTVIEDGRRGQK